MPPQRGDEYFHDSDEVLQPPQRLQCDYLVIGAGTSGMSFVDTILAEDPKATMIVVDRNEKPGGHWVNVYPFCRLHQSACSYGVNSMTLGKNLDRKGNERWDAYDLPTGQEVVEYYERVREKFEMTGRVTFFFGAEYKGFDEPTRLHRVVNAAAADKGGTSTTTAAAAAVVLEVRCRRKLVTVETNIQVPSMREPTIPVHEGASFVAVNALPASIRSGRFRNYIVFGCGKTGADAIVHLLKEDDGVVDPSKITWIVSRESWYSQRNAMEDCLTAMDTFLDPMVRCESVKDVYLEWESRGLMGRLDRSVPPEIFKGAILDAAEMELMRSVRTVVRKGRALAVEQDRIVLERGSIDYDPDTTLLVDCMVDGLYGFDNPEDFCIFGPGRIRMGPFLYFWNPSFSAAHIAFLECALGDDNDEAKNNHSYFVRGVPPKELARPETAVGYMITHLMTTMQLMKVPGGIKFFLRSRTNMLSTKHHKRGLLRMLWYSLGPKQWLRKAFKLEKKIKTMGFTDLDHNFSVDTIGTVEKAF